MKVHVVRILKSPLGLGMLMFEVLVLAGLAVTGFISLLSAFLLFVLAAGLSILLLLQTAIGARAVVDEKNRERQERDARVLGGVAAARKRLSMLRMPNEEVAASLNALVYGAGRYLELSVRGNDRDPEVEDSIFGAIEVVDDYLRLTDASMSRHKIRNSKGTAKAQSSSLQTHETLLTQRTCKALDAACAMIDQRLALSEGGIIDGVSAQIRSEIREEL